MTSTPAKPRAAVFAALRWGASFALLALVGYQLSRSWAELERNPPTFSPGWLALSFALFGVFLVFSFQLWRRWVILLGTPISSRAAFRMFYLSNLAKYLPGGVWNLVGRVALCSREGYPAATISVSILLEMGCQVCGTTLIALPTLPALSGRGTLASPWLLATLAIAMVLGLHPSVSNFVLGIAGRVFRREMPKITVGYLKILGMLGLYTLNWILLAVAFATLAAAISPDPLDRDHVLILIGAFAVSWNAGVLAFFLPAGLGVREAGLLMLMGASFAPGFPATLALVARLWILVGEIAPFAIAAAMKKDA